MTSAKYITAGVAQSALSGSWGTITFSASAGTAEAYRWVTTICPANYVTPSAKGTGTETTLSTAFAGVQFIGSIVAGALTVSSMRTSGGTLAVGMTIFGRGIANGVLQSGVTIVSGTAPNWVLSDSTINWPPAIAGTTDYFYAGSDMTAPADYIDTLGGAASGFNVAQVQGYFNQWKTWGQTFPVPVTRIGPYEGGSSPDYTAAGGPQLPVNILKFASKLVTSSSGSANGLQGYITTMMTNVTGLTGGGFTGEFPSNFQFTGPYPSDNAWAVLEDLYQPNTPSELAIIAFNN
jgi:hypothetical protein